MTTDELEERVRDLEDCLEQVRNIIDSFLESDDVDSEDDEEFIEVD